MSRARKNEHIHCQADEAIGKKNKGEAEPFYSEKKETQTNTAERRPYSNFPHLQEPANKRRVTC